MTNTTPDWEMRFPAAEGSSSPVLPLAHQQALSTLLTFVQQQAPRQPLSAEGVETLRTHVHVLREAGYSLEWIAGHASLRLSVLHHLFNEEQQTQP